MSVQVIDLGPAGSTKAAPVAGPKSWTNFLSPAEFTLIAQPEITVNFDVAGKVIFSGNAAPDGNSYLQMAGVRLNATIFPDAADGGLAWSVSFDSYTGATDIPLSTQWLCGIVLQAAGAQNANNAMNYFQAFGMKTGGGQAQAWNGQFTLNSSETAVNVTGGTADVPTAFTMAGRIGAINSGAGDFPWCIDKYILTKNVGAPIGLDPIPFNAANQVPQVFFGFKIFLGVIYSQKTALGTARLTDFTLTKGRYIAGYQSL